MVSNYSSFGQVFRVPPTPIMLRLEKTWKTQLKFLILPDLCMCSVSLKGIIPWKRPRPCTRVLSLRDLGVSGNIPQAAHFKEIQTADLTPRGSRKHRATSAELMLDTEKGKFSL